MGFRLSDELVGRGGPHAPIWAVALTPEEMGEAATMEEPKLRNREGATVNNMLLAVDREWERTEAGY